jgi:hypothetical protein
MKRLTHLVIIMLLALALISLLAACANPTGSRTSAGSNRPPAAIQPAQDVHTGSAIQSDPQADALEQALTDLDSQLKSTDMLEDLK